jgi:chromosome segregation ATPase
MTMKVNPQLRTLVAAMTLAATCAAPGFAQAPAAKDKVQTREELRACLKLKDSIAADTADLSKRQAAHEAERAEVRKLSEPVKAARPDVDASLEAVKAADTPLREHNALIEKWNAEVAEVDASKMKSAERRKAALIKERAALDETFKKLLAERDTRVKAYDAAVARYNTALQAAEGRLKAFNDRNNALEDEADALRNKKLDYDETCARRRFREEDEKAIRSGK